MLIPFASETYERGKYGLPPQTCVNMFPETSPIPGRPFMLVPCPGFEVFATIGTGPIRGVLQRDGVLDGLAYVVSGNEVYSVSSTGNSVLLGPISGGGLVDMAASGTQIAIASGTKGYVIDSSGLNEITDTDFPDISAVTYTKGYFIWATANSGQIIWSAILDATDYDALDFATAESAPDNLLGFALDHGQVIMMGSETIEPWVGTGNADAPFQPIPSGEISRGAVSRNSITEDLDNTIFFAGNDRIVYRLGASPERVSTHAIEERLSKVPEGEIVNISAWTYAQDGHTFYVLDIPTFGTFVYDLSTGKWHERRSWGGKLWEAQTGARIFGKVMAGSRDNGNLYILSKDEATYNQDHIERSATAGVPVGGGRPIAYSISLDLTVGVGLLSGQGSDPQVMLRYSDDLGRTWSTERWKSFGKIGKYTTDVTFRRLGRMRSPGRIYEFRVTDPVIFAHQGARKDVYIPK